MTTDEETWNRIDELTAASGRYASRSARVGEALIGHVETERRLKAEKRERRIIRRHRESLGEELTALVAEQARP